MTSGETIRLIDRDGLCARLALPATEGPPVVAVLDSGKAVRIPPALMVRQDSSTYRLAARFDDLPQEDQAHPDEGDVHEGQLDRTGMDEAGMVIPVVADEVRVRKERTVTGRVRLRKIVHHEEQTVDEPILKERVSVERVAIDQWVDEAPPIRSEGEMLVIPVVEEVLVVEKRLRLREEVRITWHHEEEHEPQHIVVRREEVRIERAGADQDPGRTSEDRVGHSDAGTGDDVER